MKVRSRYLGAAVAVSLIVTVSVMGCATVEQRREDLVIESEPAGASVSHQGRMLGETPVTYVAEYEVKHFPKEKDTMRGVLAGAGGLLVTGVGNVLLLGAFAPCYECSDPNYPTSWGLLAGGVAGVSVGVVGIYSAIRFFTRPRTKVVGKTLEFRMSREGYREMDVKLRFPEGGLRSGGGHADFSVEDSRLEVQLPAGE